MIMGADYSTAFLKALQYVRDNKTWTDAEEVVALQQVNERMPLPHKITDEIHDLMEEWSDENGWNEGWWLYEMDELEIFYKL